MIIQFLLSLSILGALAMTWRRQRQQAIRLREAAAWSLLWVGALVVTWWPGVSSRVANLVGIGRGADLVVYASIVILLVLVFRLHVAHEKLERQLTEIVRSDALKRVMSDGRNQMSEVEPHQTSDIRHLTSI